ncbi:hypothetical protein UlMin_012972 [Ulmus minor]
MGRDVDVSRWVLEFLLRSPGKEDLAKRALAAIPIPENDMRLKKTVLLRTIEFEVSDASVTESILENLEMVEELDNIQGVPIMGSMKAAYRAVALECTVKFLAGGGERPKERYFEALKRIWRGRVKQLEAKGKSELLTSELLELNDQVELAIWNVDVCKKFVRMNTRNDALRLVLDYLGEAWALMGPSFVELAARLTREQKGAGLEGGNVEEIAVGGVVLGEDGDDTEPPEEVEVGEMEGEKLVGGNVEEIVDRGETREPAMDKEPTEEVEVQEIMAEKLPNSGQRSNFDRCFEQTAELANRADLRREDNNGVRYNGCSDSTVRDRTATNLKDTSQPSLQSKEVAKAKMVRYKHVAPQRRSRGPVRIAEAEDSDTDIELSGNKHNSIPTPDVKKLQNALKSSVLELQAVVTDPLPEALQVAENLRAKVAAVNPSADKSTEPVRSADGAAVNPSADKSTEPVRSADGTAVNPSCSRPQPSIMERNGTAHTYEWSDSIDCSPESTEADRSRLHLPSPKRKLVSPLKKKEFNKLSKRRKIKRWTLLEEDTLRTAVLRFGKGNWKFILNSYSDIFEERTEVDLKDKWRNMSKS